MFDRFLQAYDQHLNMILSEVEETVTSVEVDEETYEEIYKVSWNVGASQTGAGWPADGIPGLPNPSWYQT